MGNCISLSGARINLAKPTIKELKMSGLAKIESMTGTAGVLRIKHQYGWEFFNAIKIRNIRIQKDNKLDIEYTDHHENRHFDFSPELMTEIFEAVHSGFITIQ